MRDYRRDIEAGEIEKLFSNDPDIIGIRELFIERKRKEQDEKLENVLTKLLNGVINEAKGFLQWDSKKFLKNSVIVAAYLRYYNLSTSQLRKIIDISRNIEQRIKNREEDIATDIIKMRFLLAYIVGKSANWKSGKRIPPEARALDAFHRVVDPILGLLISSESKNFLKFYEFLQAVLAYHRFFGGREQ